MVLVRPNADLSACLGHTWIRIAKCFGQRPHSNLETESDLPSYADLVTILWWDEVDSIGLKKVKLTFSMSYVGVRFLVGSVESSGSAEEEGEG